MISAQKNLGDLEQYSHFKTKEIGLAKIKESFYETKINDIII